MKTYWKSSVFSLSVALSLISQAHSASEIFSDNFQSGDLAAWAEAPDQVEIPKEQKWLIVSDPDVADIKQKVLCTPEMATQSYLYHIATETSKSRGLVLSFRFNADETNRQWNSTWTLFTDVILNAAYLVDGYSIRFGYMGNQDDSKPMVSISRVDPKNGLGSQSELATATLADDAFQPGWNEVRFYWKADGTLKVTLNGKEVISAKDTTYEPAFRSLVNATWLSNNLTLPSSLPDGRKLYYDDIKVDESDL